jgi:hypothetical protein
MFNQITAFERKLQLLETQLQKKNFSHFPTLKNHARDIIPDIFLNSIKNLRNEFSYRFETFRKYKDLFKLFGSPYDIDVDHVEELYQLN